MLNNTIPLVVFISLLLYNYYGDCMKIRIRKWVKITLALIVIFISIFLYSRYINTKGLEVKEYSIIDSNIPDNFYGLKIVQISDIHYKVTTNYNDLKKICNEINLLKPDIVILTGDLFDKNITYNKKDFEELTTLLNSIDYNIQKYAIKGEDDLKFDKWIDVIDNSNFKNINNTYDLIYSNGISPILLIGIESNYKKIDINNTINDINNKIAVQYDYSILVLHEPDIIDYIDYSKYNLILAGHSHNGQINIPFIGGIIKDKYAKKYSKNYYKLNNTKFYISSGIGTSKYKFRLLNKPSINLYRLRNN